VRVRYSGDRGGEDAQARVVPIAPGLKRFASRRYRSWEGKYMPREFSRLVVELLAVRGEAAGDRREAMLQLKAIMPTTERRK
jgi:hypothetical protein